MSTDTIALLDCGADFRGTVWLANTLLAATRNGELTELAPVVERWRTAWRPQAWSVDRPDRIEGPGGFMLTLTDHMVSVYHVTKWSQFCGAPALREPLRAALRAIGRLVGATRVIYHHELLGAGEGPRIDDVERHLRATFGAPSRTFEQLAAADLWAAGCWYFDDWRSATAAPVG